MKQSNMHRALYDAVSDVDPVMVEEATTARKAPTVKKIAAMAAVLALLLSLFFWPNREESYITAPGLITVRAHEVDEAGNATVESVVLEEGVVFTPEYIYRTDTSYRPNYPMFLQLEHDMYTPAEITLEVSTNSGIFYKHLPGDLSMIGKPPVEQLLYHHYGQHFFVSADTALYWQPDGFDYAYMKEQFAQGNTNLAEIYKAYGYNGNPSFFDIIIRANGYIIGYCVIEVERTPTEISPYAHHFSFKVVALVGFPTVDGKHQNVSYKYVQTQIQEIHLEREHQR